MGSTLEIMPLLLRIILSNFLLDIFRKCDRRARYRKLAPIMYEGATNADTGWYMAGVGGINDVTPFIIVSNFLMLSKILFLIFVVVNHWDHSS